MATYRNQNYSGLHFTQSYQSSGALKLTDAVNIIENCRFDDNGGTQFSTYGGALTNFEGTVQSVTISNSTFSNNSAQHGGAIAASKNLDLTNVTFTNNHANSYYGSYGGAIFVQGSIEMNYTVTSGKHISNQGNSGTLGGFLYDHNGESVYIFDVQDNASLTIGSTSTNTDSINLHKGSKLIKTGNGTMTINSSLERTNPYEGDKGITDGDFTITAGTLELNRGGSFDGTLKISGGQLKLGAKYSFNSLEFELKNSSNVAMVSDWSRLTVPVITIDIADAAAGNYVLAANAGSFNRSVTITDNTRTQSISKGQSVTINGTHYSLDLNNSNLMLTVSGDSELDSLVVTTAADVVDANDGVTSLREAIAAAASNASLRGADGKFTITFADSIFNNGSVTISLNSTLEIGESIFTEEYGELVIQGRTDGKDVILEGNNSIQIMNIGSENVITIDGMSFNNGSISGFGGAIYSEGNLTVTDCTFSGNSASYHGFGNGDGGAIYNHYGTLTVSNSVFTENNSDIVGGGAAIFNHYGYANVNHSIFTDNASSDGGAIYNRGTMAVSASTFSANFADRFGGSAIYHDRGILTVMDSTFSGNTTADTNGVIYRYSETINLINNIIVGNADDNILPFTPAIDINNLYDSTATVSEVFTEVDENGKAVLNEDGTIHILADGKAAGTGVYVWHNEDYSAIAYSETYSGSKTAVLGNVADATILSTDQLGNVRSPSSTDIGAVLSASAASPLVVTTAADVVDANDGVTSLREAVSYAQSLGGEQTITFNGDMTILLNRNLYIASPVSINANADQRVIIDGTNNSYSFLLYNTSTEKVTLSNLTFQNQRVQNDGALRNHGNLTIENCSFINNSADNTGAAFSTGNYGKTVVYVRNTTFQGNSAYRGGGINSDGLFCLIDNCIFSGNTATEFGGAIFNSYGNYSGTSMTIKDSSFQTATDTIYNHGELTLEGTISLAANFYSTGTVNADGAIINYLLTPYDSVNETVIVSDVTQLIGASYSVTVAANQAFGTYLLAGNAADFNSAISLTVGENSYADVLTVGSSYTVGDREYTLGRNSDNVLTLNIASSGTPAPLPGERPAAPAVQANITKLTNQNVIVSATFSADSTQKQYSLDNVNWQTYTSGVVMTGNGTVWFRAGNEAGYSEAVSYTVSNIDKVAPEKPTANANITAPTNQNVTVSATFSEDSVQKQYSLDGTNWKNYNSGVLMRANGTVNFRGIDAAGNISAVASYTVDNIEIPDNIYIVTNADDGKLDLAYSGKYTLTGEFGDIDGTVTVLNGGKKIGTGTIKKGVLTFNNGKSVLLDNSLATEVQITVKSGTDRNYTAVLSAETVFDKGDADSLSEPSDLGSVAEPGPLVEDGWVGFGDEFDYLTFSLDHAANLIFDFATTDAAKFTIGQMQSGKMKSLQSTAVKAGAEASTKALLLTAGDYYLTVQATNASKGGSADYTVALDGKSTFFTKGDNSDDTAASAYDLGTVTDAGELETGWVGQGDEYDYRKFTLESGAKLSFTVNATDAAKFTIWQQDGGKLKSLQSTTLKAGQTLNTKELLLNAGDYYFSMQSTNAKKGGDADYTVAVNDKSVFYTKGDNSDDTAAEAYDLGTVTDAGELDADWVGLGDEYDYRKFTLESGAKLSFTVNATDAAKFTVWQMQANGKLKSLQSTTLKAGQTLNTKELLLDAGEYYLSMQSTNAKKGGSADYTVAIKDSVFFTNGDNSDDTWNDAVDLGPVYGPGVLIENGWVGFGDEADYVSFTLNNAASVALDLSATDAASFTIYTMNPSKPGTLKKVQTTKLAAPKGGGQTAVTTKNVKLDGGTYYLEVKSTNAAKGGNAYYSAEINQNKSIFYENLFTEPLTVRADQQVNSTNVTVSWDPPQGFDGRQIQYYVSVDGGKQTAVKTTTFTAKNLSMTGHTVAVYAKDEFGNVSETTQIPFAIADTILPKVSGLSVTVSGNTANVKFKGSDNVAVGGYHVTMDGVETYITAEEYPAGGLSYGSLSAGGHSVQVQAQDSSGNLSTVLQKDFTVKGDTSGTGKHLPWSADHFLGYGSNSVYVQGNLSAAGNLYSFTTVKPGYMYFSILGKVSSAVTANVYKKTGEDDGGVLVTKVTSKKLTGSNWKEKCSFFTEQNSTYYVELTGKAGTEYTLTGSLYNSNPHNNSFADAEELTDYEDYGAYLRGMLTSTDKVDFYRFTLYHDCDVKAKVGVYDKTKIALYDSNQNLITSKTVTWTTENSNLTASLSAGDYYLKIELASSMSDYSGYLSVI